MQNLVASEDDNSDEQAAQVTCPIREAEALMEQAAADAMREELEEQEDAIQSAADEADERGSSQPNKDAPVDSEAQSNGGVGSVGGGRVYRVFIAIR